MYWDLPCPRDAQRDVLFAEKEQKDDTTTERRTTDP